MESSDITVAFWLSQPAHPQKGAANPLRGGFGVIVSTRTGSQTPVSTFQKPYNHPVFYGLVSDFSLHKLSSCADTSGATPRLAAEQAEFFVSEVLLEEMLVAPGTQSGEVWQRIGENRILHRF